MSDDDYTLSDLLIQSPHPSLKRRLQEWTVPGPNGCILWIGAVNRWGYGKTSIGRNMSPTGRIMTTGAHKLAWYVQTGFWPKDPICVLHTCDNPPCVNFAHLFLGSHEDNMNDMLAKGRHAAQRGTLKCIGPAPERSSKAKLTWDKVREIRSCKEDISQEKLARRYDVVQTTISDILANITWKE